MAAAPGTHSKTLLFLELTCSWKRSTRSDCPFPLWGLACQKQGTILLDSQPNGRDPSSWVRLSLPLTKNVKACTLKPCNNPSLGQRQDANGCASYRAIPKGRRIPQRSSSLAWHGPRELALLSARNLRKQEILRGNTYSPSIRLSKSASEDPGCWFKHPGWWGQSLFFGGLAKLYS